MPAVAQKSIEVPVPTIQGDSMTLYIVGETGLYIHRMAFKGQASSSSREQEKDGCRRNSTSSSQPVQEFRDCMTVIPNYDAHTNIAHARRYPLNQRWALLPWSWRGSRKQTCNGLSSILKSTCTFMANTMLRSVGHGIF